MRFLSFLCALTLSASAALSASFKYPDNPNITVHFGDKVSDESRQDVFTGIRQIDEYFQRTTGDRFEGDVNVVVYYNNSFARRTIPSKFRNSSCDGGYASGHDAEIQYAVICLGSEVFKRADAKGKLGIRTRELVIHELTHVMQGQWRNGNAYPRNEPHWIREADANYLGKMLNGEKPTEDAVIAKMLRDADTSIPLERIRSKNDFAKYTPYSYSNTALATHWREQRYGMDAIKDYWQLSGQTGSYKSAFASAFGMSLYEFYDQFEYGE